MSLQADSLQIACLHIDRMNIVALMCQHSNIFILPIYDKK